MDAQSRDVVTWLLGTCVTLSILVGLAVKFVLLPWLRDHLFAPLHDTRQQVTDNGHTSDPPTLPDMIHEVRTDVGALTRVMDEHLSWSDRWTDLIEREVAFLLRQLEVHHGTQHRTERSTDDDTNPTT